MAIETQMNASPDQQVSLTDPDARSMKNREGGIVGYNVQTAVDAQHHLIVAHDQWAQIRPLLRADCVRAALSAGHGGFCNTEYQTKLRSMLCRPSYRAWN